MLLTNRIFWDFDSALVFGHGVIHVSNRLGLLCFTESGEFWAVTQSSAYLDRLSNVNWRRFIGRIALFHSTGAASGGLEHARSDADSAGDAVAAADGAARAAATAAVGVISYAAGAAVGRAETGSGGRRRQGDLRSLQVLRCGRGRRVWCRGRQEVLLLHGGTR